LAKYGLGYILGDYSKSLGDFSQQHLVTLLQSFFDFINKSLSLKKLSPDFHSNSFALRPVPSSTGLPEFS
jgi:hypothetical protein